MSKSDSFSTLCQPMSAIDSSFNKDCHFAAYGGEASVLIGSADDAYAMACVVYDVFAADASLRLLFYDRGTLSSVSLPSVCRDAAWCKVRDHRLALGVPPTLVQFLQGFIAPKRFRRSMRALLTGCLDGYQNKHI